MSVFKGAVRRFVQNLFAGWRNVYRLTSKAMAASSVLAVLLTWAIGVWIGAAFVVLGSAVAGEPGAWLGATAGIIVGGMFVGRVLDEL